MTKQIQFIAVFATFLLLSAAPLAAVEIATGKMLGKGYDERSFYMRSSGKESWRKTYSGREFKPEAAGRMMNLRIAQALFHDEWMTEKSFDPEKNTNRVIAALDSYKNHGILAISVSLQGGNMAYELTSDIQRTRGAKLGKEKGSLVSAFRPDGSLKDAWMKRALRLTRELDKRGMVMNLMYFYAHQDEVFKNTSAVDRAVVNVTDWVIDNNLRNVLIEIANEHDIKAWDHDRYVHENIGKLIQLARSRFSEKKVDWRLPISASTGGSMAVFDGVRDHGDVTIIHGNNKTPEQKRARVAELHKDPKMPGPIYMNEDNNGRETTPENLKLELASCDAVWESGGSWGYMPWRQLQIFPFRHYAPGASSKLSSGMTLEQSDPVYFRAVLEHIKGLLYRDGAVSRR